MTAAQCFYDIPCIFSAILSFFPANPLHICGLPEDEDIDSNTVNGLVQEKTCHLPKVGDRFTLGEYDGVVTRTAKRRVTEVRLTPADKPEPKKDEEDRQRFNRITNK